MAGWTAPCSVNIRVSDANATAITVGLLAPLNAQSAARRPLAPDSLLKSVRKSHDRSAAQTSRATYVGFLSCAEENGSARAYHWKVLIFGPYHHRNQVIKSV